jgi:2-keto-4-pentenoate hydratase/2-oxohepta-3-ene-1,7-dioic acid hydratase in catechol pathway
MRICRYNFNRLGVVQERYVTDVTHLFDLDLMWPLPMVDRVIAQISDLIPRLRGALSDGVRLPLDTLRLESPVANPGKIIGAPINYRAHIEEANADNEINTGKVYTSIDEFGLFLKAGSSLIGVSDPIIPRFPSRRTDHEVELAVIIGKACSRVRREDALAYVLGYTIALDMTVRGKEFPSFRKSPDGYSVLGPWIVTSDEITNPNNLNLQLSVNGEIRQKANTNLLIFNVERLIEYASQFYTLHPGDVIMTGTPAGVGPVNPGDTIDASIECIGSLRMRVGGSPPLN